MNEELLIAIIQEDINTIRKYLYEKNVSLNRYYTLRSKPYQGNPLKSLNDKYKSLNLSQDFHSFKTYLMYAANTDNVEIFDLLLKNGAELVLFYQDFTMSSIKVSERNKSKKILEYLKNNKEYQDYINKVNFSNLMKELYSKSELMERDSLPCMNNLFNNIDNKCKNKIKNMADEGIKKRQIMKSITACNDEFNESLSKQGFKSIKEKFLYMIVDIQNKRDFIKSIFEISSSQSSKTDQKFYELLYEYYGEYKNSYENKRKILELMFGMEYIGINWWRSKKYMPNDVPIKALIAEEVNRVERLRYPDTFCVYDNVIFGPYYQRRSRSLKASNSAFKYFWDYGEGSKYVDMLNIDVWEGEGATSSYDAAETNLSVEEMNKICEENKIPIVFTSFKK